MAFLTNSIPEKKRCVVCRSRWGQTYHDRMCSACWRAVGPRKPIREPAQIWTTRHLSCEQPRSIPLREVVIDGQAYDVMYDGSRA